MRPMWTYGYVDVDGIDNDHDGTHIVGNCYLTGQCFSSDVPGLAASVSPENLLEMQMLEPHAQTCWKQNFRAGSHNLGFNKSSSLFGYSWKFSNHLSMAKITRSCGSDRISWDLSLCIWESSQRGKSVVNLAVTPKKCQVKLVHLSGS